MSPHEIEPLQRLFLYRLLVVGGGDWLKDVKPVLQPSARRTRLSKLGLTVEEKRSRDGGRPATYIELTEQGWAWIAQDLGNPLPAQSTAGTAVLQRVCTQLRDYFARSGAVLGEVFVAPRAPESPKKPESKAAPTGDLKQRIESACRELSRKEPNARVRLASLRERLDDVPRELLDRTLLDLETAGTVILYQLNNPRAIGPEDRRAELRTPSGEPRHILYLQGARA